MKWTSLILLSLGMTLTVAAQDGLSEVQKTAETESQAIDAAYKAELGKLRDQILIALGKARDTAKKDGDLDGVKTIDAEIARWKEEGDLPLVEPDGEEIAKLNQVYKTSAADRLLKKQRAILAWFRAYDARLASLEKTLVAADQIKEAEEVRSERDARRESMTVSEATEAVKAADEKAALGRTTAGEKKANSFVPENAWSNLKGVKWKKATGNSNFMRVLDNFDREISIDGRRLKAKEFIFAHAFGRIEYEFEKPVSGFRGSACLAKEASNLDQSDIIFSIETDEGEVYRSKLIKASNLREDINIAFKPSKKLVLVVDDNGKHESDWSFWLNPQYR